MQITIEEIIIQLSQRLDPLSETARLDSQVLVAHHLGKPRTWVMSHPEAIVDANQYTEILNSAERLEQGEPLPYVLGHWEFYGLDFCLTPAVLIPRPETELLVQRAIDWLQAHPHFRRAIDIGTGSGCIGISLAKHIPDLQLILTDVSTDALEIAQINTEKHGLSSSVKFLQSDLLEQIHEPFDLICANLPYIPTRKLEKLAVLKREPRIALDGGKSGIIQISKLLKQAACQLNPGGKILVEIEAMQGNSVASMAQKLYPRASVQVLKDLSGRERCLEIDTPSIIGHLCTYDHWIKSQAQGEYRDDSLDREGFIHCSGPGQILNVANIYYKDVPDMIVIWIYPAKLHSEIRWELSGEYYFPHVYGAINLDAVVSTSEFERARDGTFRSLREH